MTADTTSILVGTDFSDSADGALAQALHLAAKLGARIDLVHVCQLPVPAIPELWLSTPAETGAVAQADRMLQALRQRVRSEQIPCHSHLRLGDPVLGMLEVIEILKPQFIVLGSHGRGALMRALLGSVSERMCRKSPVPVLVVPARGRAAAAQESDTEEAQRAVPVETAWSCARCGHIRGKAESAARCAHCGMENAVWDSAPISRTPADELAPAVGESMDEHIDAGRANDPAGLFSTSPPGTEGYSINPELRVRY